MNFHELSFNVRCAIHWGICGVLAWIGWDNPDATFILVIMAVVAYCFCYTKELQDGHW